MGGAFRRGGLRADRARIVTEAFRAEQAIGVNPDKTGYVLRAPDSDGARGLTERNVRIEAVPLERTMTPLNCRDLDIDGMRQLPMHQIQRDGVLPGTRQASLPGVSRSALDVRPIHLLFAVHMASRNLLAPAIARR